MNDLSIVDSHVHLWNPAQLRYAWLDGLPALNRAFLPEDFAAASAGANVSKIIFVECGCEPAQSLAEVDWISDLAKAEPRMKGVVAHAPLEKGGCVRADLEKLAANPLVKGVRRNLQGERDSEFCLRPEFVAGVKLLAEFRFHFRSLHPARTIARRCRTGAPRSASQFCPGPFWQTGRARQKDGTMGGGFENARGVAECRLQNFRPDDRSGLEKLAAGRFEILF